ncbi:MAG: response regulator transcription factor [Vicinamibacterales bacterium]
MIRILLVDDHPVARHGIKSLLGDRMKEAVIYEASDAVSALLQVRDGGWDLVIVDLSMPGMSGLELIKEIRQAQPGLPTLALSMHPPSQFARRALSAGAIGYITKDAKLDEFMDAVDAARQGQRYISPNTADLLRHAAKWDTLPHESLSDREYQVLRLLGSGQTISDIGRNLGLSVKTISTYRARVLEKLGMRTSAELMRYAIENQLLEA